MVGSEFPGAHFATVVQDCALALTLVIAPLSVVDLSLRKIELATSASSLAFNVFADVDIASSCIDKSTLTVTAVLFPVALVYIT